jgi:hypothetical protein
MTPLEQSNGEGTLIINRGWVPMNVVQGNKIAPDARNWEEPTGEVEIVGVPTQVDGTLLISNVVFSVILCQVSSSGRISLCYVSTNSLHRITNEIYILCWFIILLL